jgi:hypothetical protein
VNERLAKWLPHSGLCELLVATFLFRALLPLGYMPARDANGGLTLQLCSVASLLLARGTRAPDPSREGGRHGPDDGDHGLCPHVCGVGRQRERSAEA